MMIKILAFGIAKDIVGGNEVVLETPAELFRWRALKRSWSGTTPALPN